MTDVKTPARVVGTEGAVIAALVLALLGLQGVGAEWLEYRRSAVIAGEYWRLITGHLVHLGWSHALLNLAGLLLVWALFRGVMRARDWLLAAAAAAAAIDAGFLLLQPNLAWYVGLSGVLHGLLAAGVILSPAGLERRFLAAVLIGKLAWEQWIGPLPFTAEAAGGPVVVDAHLYGAIGGSLAAFLLRVLRARALTL